MSQRVSIVLKTSVVTLTPIARILRTVIQTVLAFGAAEPTLIGLVHMTGAQASEVAGIVAGLVALAALVQNLLEQWGVLPTTGGKAATAEE